MSGLRLSLDSVQYTSKPEDQREKALLSSRIGSQIEEINSKRELVYTLYDIGTRGKTFCPATFINGKRNRENFEQTRMLVLDFDKTIHMGDVFDRTEKYNLPILFAYETLPVCEQGIYYI